MAELALDKREAAVQFCISLVFLSFCKKLFINFIIFFNVLILKLKKKITMFLLFLKILILSFCIFCVFVKFFDEKFAKYIAFIFSLFIFFSSVFLIIFFDFSELFLIVYQFSFSENFVLNLVLALDVFSFFFLLLTTFLMSLIILSS